jgi:hypothetical protein
MTAHPHDRAETLAEFKRVVNMTPAALGKWLDSSGSQSVGMTPEGERVSHEGGEESVGHGIGRCIMELKASMSTALTDDGLAVMRKVIGYVHRHMDHGNDLRQVLTQGLLTGTTGRRCNNRPDGVPASATWA